MTLANKITLVRIGLIPIFIAVCYIYPLGPMWAAAGVFLLAAISDFVDGAVARRMGQVTTFGKFIDPIADKLLVCSAIILLVENGSLHALPAIIIIARELIVSGFRLVAASDGHVIAASFIAKLKTVVQIIMVMVLLLGNFPFLYIGLPVDIIMVWAASILTIWSGWDYIAKNWSHMRF